MEWGERVTFSRLGLIVRAGGRKNKEHTWLSLFLSLTGASIPRSLHFGYNVSRCSGDLIHFSICWLALKCDSYTYSCDDGSQVKRTWPLTSTNSLFFFIPRAVNRPLWLIHYKYESTDWTDAHFFYYILLHYYSLSHLNCKIDSSKSIVLPFFLCFLRILLNISSF